MWNQQDTRSSRSFLPPIPNSPQRRLNSPSAGDPYRHLHRGSRFTSSSPSLATTRRPQKGRIGPGTSPRAGSGADNEPAATVRGSHPGECRLQLERRVAMLEQANRNFLEELVYVKGFMVRNEELTEHRATSLKEDIKAHVTGPLDILSQQVQDNSRNIELNARSLSGVVQQSEREDLSSVLKLQVGELQNRAAELADKVEGLRATVRDLEAERRTLEQWMKDSFIHFRDQLSWLSRNSSQSLDSIAIEVEKNSHNVASKQSQLARRLLSSMEQESQLQVERIDKALSAHKEDVRKVLMGHDSECSCRTDELRAQITAQINEHKQELILMKQTLQKAQREREGALAVLAEALSLQEAECRLGREEHSVVLSAEIQTRQKELQSTELAVNKLREVWRTSLGALREGLLSLEERTAVNKKAVEGQQQQLVAEWQGVCEGLQADVAARITALHEHISRQAQTTSGEESAGRQQEHWQGLVNTEMESLQKQLSQHSASLDRLTASLQELQLNTVGLIHKETNQRFYSILDIKKEIANIKTQLPMLFKDSPFPEHEDEPVTAAAIAAEAVHELARPLQLLHDEEQVIATASGDRGYSSEVERPRAVSRAPAFDYEGLISEQAPAPAFPQDDDDSSSGEESLEKFEQPLLTRSLFGLKREQFETSPEPRSLQSSMSENVVRKGRVAQTRARLSRSHRNRLIHERHHLQHAAVQEFFDGAETQGTFTSAPATPPSRQKVLLRHPSEEESDQGDSSKHFDHLQGSDGELWDGLDNDVKNEFNGEKTTSQEDFLCGNMTAEIPEIPHSVSQSETQTDDPNKEEEDGHRSSTDADAQEIPAFAPGTPTGQSEHEPDTRQDSAERPSSEEAKPGSSDELVFNVS